MGAYAPDAPDSRFQLVGPDDLPALGDFERWVIPDGLSNQSVSYDAAKRNLHVIGGDVAKKPEGSHYKVTFKGASRSWVLDSNEDPVQERYLDELKPLTGLPGDVIRYALACGKLPPREPFF
ncbi:MAG TPA: hypothetical protein VHD85_07960 [Terracidiphilus sp.]|nr:hypothetical protein [Terracidiphilus sp.]